MLHSTHPEGITLEANGPCSTYRCLFSVLFHQPHNRLVCFPAIRFCVRDAWGHRTERGVLNMYMVCVWRRVRWKTAKAGGPTWPQMRGKFAPGLKEGGKVLFLPLTRVQPSVWRVDDKRCHSCASPSARDVETTDRVRNGSIVVWNEMENPQLNYMLLTTVVEECL